MISLLAAANEAGSIGAMMIQNVTLTNTGLTLSVDDVYTETTYTYLAEHVTPFIQSPSYDAFLNKVRGKMVTHKLPDQIMSESVLELYNVTIPDSAPPGFADYSSLSKPGSTSAIWSPSVTTDPILQEMLSQMSTEQTLPPGFQQIPLPE